MSLRIAWIALWVAMVASAFCQDANVVKEIVVTGNKRVSKEAIFTTMSTKVGALYSQSNIDNDRRALEETGFFSAVDVRGVPIESGTNWQVLVNVSEFPEIKEIRLTGNSAIKSEDILKQLGPSFQPGHVFNTRELVPAAQAIEKLYAEKGFLARVVEFGPLAESPGTINLVLLEAKVGTVSVQGNKLTKDRVLRRLIKTRSGETFNATKWGNDLRRLLNTQWFESVRSLEDTQRELGAIDLTADVKEARTGTFNVGLQVDPRSSLAGIVRYTQANIGGTGQGIDLNYLQTTRGGGASVDLSYSNPFIDSKDTTLRASIFSRVVYRFAGGLFGQGSGPSSDNQYFERRNGGSFGLSRPLNDYQSVGASLRIENVRTENTSALIDSNGQASTNFIQQDGAVAVLTLGGTQNRRDRDVEATRGTWLQLQVEPGYSNINKVGGNTTDESILGTHYFVKNSIEFRTYINRDKPLGREIDAPRKVLAFKVRYGIISGQVPFFEQYFAGGPDTVRGYVEDRFWGRQQFLSSLEYRYPIQKSFSLVGFIDYGGAWGGYGTVNDFTQSPNFKLHLGYGPGVSFRTPLGNIQVFLGFNDEGKSRTHFLIGNSF